MNVVLHICCGVCATGAVDSLRAEGYQVTGLFYNPNIYPVAEYQRRLKAARIVAGKLDFPLVIPPYRPQEWYKAVASVENEPEGGRRCAVCFDLRLTMTYQYMLEQGFDAFTTTLTVGPRKSAVVVNRVGREIGGERFLARNFKKRGGFTRAVELAKKWALYRQDYCGCKYSLRG
ncbi:epoxyqueuosine reductase QueH [Chloroflexota bacterium]